MADKDIAEFQEWLKTLTTEQLHRLLVDAYWKGQLSDTELVRFFKIENEHGQRMIPTHMIPAGVRRK